MIIGKYVKEVHETSACLLYSACYSVCYMGPLIWNKLPVSIRIAGHLLSFKKK